MFPKASPGDRFTKIWSKEFYNFLLSQIKQDLNLTHKQKSFTYDPVKALCKDDETILGFTPVALLEATQIRGGFKAPVIRIGELVEDKAWGVLQSKCTQTQAADLVVAGVSWCNVTINSISHQFAKIEDNELVSQADEEDAVARIIAPIEEGPSLIQFPLPGKTEPVSSLRYASALVRATADFDHSTFLIPIELVEVKVGVLPTPYTFPGFVKNTLQKWGLSDVYAYGGLAGTLLQIDIDFDLSADWRILEVTCTIPCCEEGSEPSDPEPSDPETSDPPPP